MNQPHITRQIAVATLVSCFIIGFGAGAILGVLLNQSDYAVDTGSIIVPCAITGGGFGATALILRLWFGTQAQGMLLGLTGLALTNFGIVLGILLVS